MIDQPTPGDSPPPRNCSNCACYGHLAANGMIEGQAEGTTPVCRRNPPGASVERREVPQLDPVTKAPLIDRGRPRMVAAKVIVIGYPATAPDAVCFDGWRPAGTLPGVVQWQSQRMLADLAPWVRKLLSQAQPAAARELDALFAALGQP